MPPKKNSKVIEPVTETVVDAEIPKVVKTTKSKKKDVEVPQNQDIDVEKPKKKSVEQAIIVEKPKKKVESIKPKKEIKPKKIIEVAETIVDHTLQNVEESQDESDLIIRKELEEVKLSWLAKQNRLTEIEAEKTKIENDKQSDIKRLKELLDKVQTPDKLDQGFLIDNKVQLINTKSDIIPVDSDSDSDNESDNDTSDSESDKKPMLTKGKKTKPLIKTTKGSTKNLKLVINDSGSESD